MLDLAGKHVVITGASSGIGRALALEMAGYGAKIALLARRQNLLDQLAQEVVALGGEALAISTDVTDKDAVEAALTRARDTWGDVDVLVANAGIGRNMSARAPDVSLIEEIMQVNFLGVVYPVCAVLPSMIERDKGSIMAVSSLAAWRGTPKFGPYCASKSAVSAWMEALRVELGDTRVRLSTAHPGFIRTPLTEKNKFKMPFLVEVDVAARILIRGIRKGRSEINFPWPLVIVMRAVRHFPNWLFDRLLSRGV